MAKHNQKRTQNKPNHSKQQHQDQRQNRGLSTSQQNQILMNIPDRFVYEYEPKVMFPKFKIPIDEKLVIDLNDLNSTVGESFKMSNIPLFKEEKIMQFYEFSFSTEELKKMIQTPKIIIDKGYLNFDSDFGLVHRTNFFAVAPQISPEDHVPNLYRFSISQNIKDKNHYSISVYAIVKGCQDGFLFLGRLDQSDRMNHTFSTQKDQTMRFVRNHNAIPADQTKLTQKQLEYKKLIEQACEGQKVFESILYKVPHPHIHQIASPEDEELKNPEKVCPKFLRTKVDNGIEENIKFMLKRFNICEKPHFRQTNQKLSKILSEEKTFIDYLKTNNKVISSDDIFSQIKMMGGTTKSNEKISLYPKVQTNTR